MPHHISIVGAGFCGTVLAAKLLRHSPGKDTIVTLIERTPEVGRGVAYAKRDWSYLLNVPAGRLSTDSREPLQFLHFARQTIPEADPEDFLPRELYGEYLQNVLRNAERDASPRMRLVRTLGEVTKIKRPESHTPIELEIPDRDRVFGDRVILAVGNPPPLHMSWAQAVHDHPAYCADPWAPPRGLEPHHVAVIVGNGLTMADVALRLGDDVERIPQLISISRHGLLPLSQTVFRSASFPEEDISRLERAVTIRELLAAARVLATQTTARGGDWREVVTLFRNVAPRLWQRLPIIEQVRFLRHLQTYWDVHRHRLPPQMSLRLESLRRSGRLEFNAGRIIDVRPYGDRLSVTWRRRGSDVPLTVEADAVVNATGPDYSVRRSLNPLIRTSLEGGFISEDALQLGLRTDPNGACISVSGSASQRLYYLGPMLRATHWEATAATELRDHAERMASHLIKSLS